MEEFYKILRSGHAEEAMRQLRATGLMKEITSELAAAPESIWRSIAALDRYRNRFVSAPESLTNAILAGTLLHPMGLIRRQRFSADPLERKVELGMLPIARRDVERLQQIIAIQPKLLDLEASPRAQRGLLHRAILDEALTWLEVHGDRPDAVVYWRELKAQTSSQPAHAADGAPEAAPSDTPFRRRRRRRRRRGNYGARS